MKPGTHFCFIMPYHISEDRGGGAEVQAWFLAKELARRGFRVSYVAQSVRGRQGTAETVDGVRIHWIRNANYLRWSNAAAYYRALSRIDADIVVQRMTSFMTGVAALWCRLRKRKFVWMCSDNASPIKWTFWRSQRAANRTAKVGWPKSALFLFNALAADLSRNWGMRRIWLAFTQNETQRTILEKDFRLPSRRMISGHPVPAKPIRGERKLERPIVLWAGNLGPNKRPEKFIELAQLAQNTKLQFVMIGGHSSSARTDALFADMPSNLTWLGRVSFDQALAHFDEAAFFVNTSMAEGFPNTFIQAWLRGIPVLSLDVDPDGIINRSGVGLAPATLPEMLGFMNSMLADPPAYLRISAAAYSLAAGSYSVEHMADHFLEQIEEWSRDFAPFSGSADTRENAPPVPGLGGEAKRG